jgi:glycosyltransferase involved in cell wall biosynthesis
MNILYVSSYTNLAARRANVTNVVYMCDALARHGVTVWLVAFVPWNKLLLSKSILTNIDPDLNFKLIPIPYINLKGIYLLFDLLAFFLAVVALINGCKVYTRNCRFSRYLYRLNKNFFIELHDFSLSTQYCLETCKNVKYFPISEGIINSIENKFSSRRMYLLPDASKLAEPSGYTIGAAGPTLTYVGSSNPGKGLEFILSLAEELKDLTFVLVGDLPKSKKLPNLIYMGYLHKRDISSIIQSSDILLAPYQSHVLDNAGNDISNYMSPLKIFEYMESNTPFICTRAQFLQNFLVENEHCLMAETSDTKEWIEKIRLILEDNKVGSDLSRNARSYQQEFFTWEKRAQKVISIMRRGQR